MKKRLIPFFILLAISLQVAHSQNDNYFFYHAHEAWEGGLDFGFNSFYGDVNDNSNKILPATPFQASFYKDRHFVFGGYFGKRMTPFWTLALEFKVATKVSGKDKTSDLAFESYFNNEVVVSNALDILSMCNMDTRWSFYPKIGFGVYGFRSKMWNTVTGRTVTYPDNMEETYLSIADAPKPMGYRYAFGMPVALGVGYRPLPELRVFFETGITWVADDYVDVMQSGKSKFEGVWNTVIGVSYQFNFPPHYGKSNPRNAGANEALKDDGTSKKYKKMRYKSNLGTGKPRYSTSSAMKKVKK